ncbi:MAG: hypothetical protein IIT65_13385 [Lachnospiraceae bacterium]|nr:hypothetical protein [Lachnospiraceae bacterium]
MMIKIKNYLACLLSLVMTNCSTMMTLDKGTHHYVYYQSEHYTFILDQNDVFELLRNDNSWYHGSYTKQDIEMYLQQISAKDSFVVREFPVVPPMYENYQGYIEIHDLVAHCIKPLFKKKRVVVYNNYTKKLEDKYFVIEKRWYVKIAGEEFQSFEVRLLKNGNKVYYE